MDLENNLKNENLKDIYEMYLKVKRLMEELEKSKKELPPKEEL